MAVLSLAWWGAKLTGVTATAAALAASVAVILSLIVGGITWLRHDAAQAERAAWSVRMAKAQASAEKDARAKLAEAEKVSLAEAEKWRVDLEAAEAARVELEKLLTEKQANAVCFTADMVEALNR